MALSRYNATSLLTRTRYANNENAVDGLGGKAGLGKSRATTAAGQRAKLGNLNINVPTAQTNQEQAKKGQKESIPQKPSRVASKQPAVTDQENVCPTRDENQSKDVSTKAKQEPGSKDKPCSPAPMDISNISAGEDAFSKQLLKANVQDIDKDDKDNPQLVSEYVNDIYEYMRELERKYPIQKRYLDGQDINGRMRGILVDWLVQVHLRFHLLQETLFLTVSIIDRFLQVQEVSRSRLQLVGVTAMLIASKYEEMYAPEIADFVYITDNAYTKADIRKMECLMLRSLDFHLGRPLPLHFLRRNSKAGEVDATKHTLAKYLMELTIVDYDMVHQHPSMIAAAALCLSMKVLDHSEWSDTLAYYSKYTEKELMPIMKRMATLVLKSGSGKLTAVKTKYTSSKFMKISNIPELKTAIIQDLADLTE